MTTLAGKRGRDHVNGSFYSRHVTRVPCSCLNLPSHLLPATSQHAAELPAVLEDLSLSQADKNTQLNTLKMNCFLLVHLVEAFEVETYKAALGNVEPSGKVRGLPSLWQFSVGVF